MPGGAGDPEPSGGEGVGGGEGDGEAGAAESADAERGGARGERSAGADDATSPGVLAPPSPGARRCDSSRSAQRPAASRNPAGNAS